MPESSLFGKDWVSCIYKSLKGVRTVLDVGVGIGTYYHQLQNLNSPKKFWIGVEVFKPYIKKYKLDKHYSLIINANIMNVKDLYHVDLVIFGDVLEHLTKVNAEKIIKRFQGISKYMIFVLPLGVSTQDKVNNNAYEKHIATWTHSQMLELLPSIKSFHLEGNKGLYLTENKF